MTVKEFARKLTLLEGKKKSVSIAQVLEILKIVNQLFKGELYAYIRKLR